MKNRGVICIALAAIIALSWVVGIKNATESSSGYKQHMKLAAGYEKEGLYQKAIDEYNSALTFEDTLDVRLKIIDMYKSGIANQEITTDGNLVDMILDSIASYKERPSIYEVASDYFTSVKDYENLQYTLDVAKKNKIISKKLDKTRETVCYFYDQDTAHFSDTVHITNGFYVVKSMGDQYSMDQNLKTQLKKCDFIAPYSSSGETVAKKANKVFIVDSKGVRQKYLPDEVESSSGIGMGLISCKIGDKYAYYDTEGKKASKDYAYAGRFAYGVAAVQTEAGKWSLINTKFEVISKTTYEDIKLNSAEQCAAAGLVLAKSNGKYQLLTVDFSEEKPEKVSVEVNGSFSCEDCDLPCDAGYNGNKKEQWFAFCSGGKWGFADEKGKTVIEPKYAGAHSFSNGYAGVTADNKQWGFINSDAELVIKTTATDVSYFSEFGICLIQLERGYWTDIRMIFWNI